MNRESSTYFSQLPQIHINRSKIIKDHSLRTTWNVGDLVPCYIDSVDPGTSISMKLSSVMRTQTPLFPTMDTLYTDILFFAIPYRLVWDHFREFWGETPSAWIPQVEYEIPQVYTTNDYKFQAKSLADYMGLPLDVPNISVSALPFRAYVKVWNDWFRSTVVDQEAANVTTDNNYETRNFTGYSYRGGPLLKVNKMHDLFTSALKEPQRGPTVTIPLGTIAPVYPMQNDINLQGISQTINSLRWGTTATTDPFTSTGQYNMIMATTTSGDHITEAETTAQTTATATPIYPANLYTDLSSASSATVGALRSALAMQHYFEQIARYGNRYREQLRGVWGVDPSDKTLQVTEYLGGVRIPHSMQTVVQTSSTDATSPQGNTAAFSHTVSSDEIFTKSFEEHTLILGVLCTRYRHSYSQGIPAMWSKKKFTDFWIPQFEGISEVPVYNKEIYATGTSTDDEVFGYQEYGYSERYGCGNIVTSEMRPTYATSLDAWHFGDNYTQLPTLSAAWMKEDKANVDRSLAVTSAVSDQLFGDFYFHPTYVLPMPIYSIPGMNKF